jgi:hypothetical protein
MQRIAFKAFLTAMTAASVVCSSASAQGQTPAACSLLSNADVEKVTGRHLYTDPDQTSLADAGSACTFDIAQVILFSGDRSEERWTAYVRRWGHGDEPRLPVSGVGDRAYVFYPKPRDQYEGVHAVVVVRVGQHTIGVSVEAEEGQPAESVRPQAIALARMVAAKLR